MVQTSKTKKTKALFLVGAIALLLAIVLWFVAVPLNRVVGGENFGVLPGLWWTQRALFGQACAAFCGNAEITIAIFYLGVGIGIVALVSFCVTRRLSDLANFFFALIAAVLAAYMYTTLQIGLLLGGFSLSGKVLAGICLSAVLLVLVLILLSTAISLALHLIPVVERVPELKEERVRELAREELAAQPKEEKEEGVSEERVALIVEDKTLKETRVREIIREELAKESSKPAPVKSEKKEKTAANAPAKAEEVKPAEEAKEAEIDTFGNLPGRRRASFETKLKNSEYDLRHKYYDLRDHIKSYGINNRISIPGDTFSLHRERLAFLTISGKHIKAAFALDPEEYKDSTIPFERNDSKKFEDLPLSFKIKSDLSFRRALKLVDDMMAKKGYVQIEKKSSK